MQDVRLFPDLVFVSRARWRRLIDPYVLEVDRVFAGVCGVYSFDRWIKLGPLVLLKKYHGCKLGKRLLKTIIDDHSTVSVVTLLAASREASSPEFKLVFV